MVHYTWQDEADAKKLYADEQYVGTIVPFAHDAVEYEDDLAEVENGVFRWTRRFRLSDPAFTGAVRLLMDFVANHHAEYAMIPGVSYNGNEWGTGQDPKGFVRDGQPWSFAYHRTAVAGATYSEGQDWSVALFGEAEPPFDVGFSCSLVPEETQTTHRLIWPEEEKPFVYSGRNQYDQSYARRLSLKPGEDFVATAYLVVEPVTTPRTSWRKFIDVAWTMNHHTVQPWFSPERIWELGVQFAKESLWAEEGVFRGFSIGLLWGGDKWQQRPVLKYEIAWCGKNAQLANALLHDYLLTGDETSLEMGIATLDTWTTHARLPNGMIRGRLDPLLEGYEGPREVQDACNLGLGASHIFDGYLVAQACGVDKPQYKETALGVCDFAVRVQDENGRFGKAWLNDGTLIDPHGTIGCFLVPPLVKAYKLTGEAGYLNAAKKGLAYYMGELLNDGYTTAGALDTHCIDKESSYPVFEASLLLYEVTEEPIYLEWAECAAVYLSTWQWHHTVHYPPGTALHDLKYDTFGGTSVSTQHQHLDPYALAWVVELLKLAELTGDAIWQQRAQAIWANGSMGISDGDLVVMEKRRPAGSQDEGFFHTRWGSPFNVSQWLVAWPTAMRLEALRRVEDWSILG